MLQEFLIKVTLNINRVLKLVIIDRRIRSCHVEHHLRSLKSCSNDRSTTIRNQNKQSLRKDYLWRLEIYRGDQLIRIERGQISLPRRGLRSVPGDLAESPGLNRRFGRGTSRSVRAFRRGVWPRILCRRWRRTIAPPLKFPASLSSQ